MQGNITSSNPHCYAMKTVFMTYFFIEQCTYRAAVFKWPNALQTMALNMEEEIEVGSLR